MSYTSKFQKASAATGLLLDAFLSTHMIDRFYTLRAQLTTPGTGRVSSVLLTSYLAAPTMLASSLFE